MKNFRKRIHNISFTLMELIVVLAIIVVMSSMGIPSLRQTLSRAEFREGTVMLQTELQKTRLLAMKTGVPYVFHFQKGTGIYQILPKEDYIKIYQRKNNDVAGEGASSGSLSGILGGSLSGSNNGGEDPFDGIARFEEAETESDNLNTSEQMDYSSNFLPARSDSDETNSSGGSRFSGSLDSSSNENFASQNNDSINSMIQVGNDFDSSGIMSEEASLPSAVRELPGRVQFDGITISAVTPFGYDNHSEESDSSLEMGGSQFSGTLGTFSNSVNGESLHESGFSTPTDQMTTNLGQFSRTDGLTSFGILPQANWGEPILFYSNGRTSHAVIHLKSSSGDNFWHSEVALRGLTGAARINYIE